MKEQGRYVGQEDERSDTLLFQTRWIAIKETKYGFQFAERAGRNSIVLFLLRQKKGNEPQILIR